MTPLAAVKAGRMEPVKIDMVIARSTAWPEKALAVEIVDVAPHLASVMTFALGPGQSRGWRMHNLETGMYLCDGLTKDACIREATKILKDITPQRARGRLMALARQCPAEIGAPDYTINQRSDAA